MDPLSSKTVELFKKNRFAGHFNYVRTNEVVPHFFSRGSYFLTRDEDTKTLAGHVNSCLHRGFKLVPARAQLKPDQPIGCKFHNWKYNRRGELLETPGFDKEVKGCLKTVDLTSINGGFFFETDSIRSATPINNVLSASIHLHGDLGLENYSFDQENVTFYPCNWKTFMEVYLDAYHHKHANPNGLGKFLTDDVEWNMMLEGTSAVFKISPADTIIPSFGWSKFNEEVRKTGWDKEWGATLITVFPGFMLEIYPHTLVISQLVPISDKMTANYLQIFYAPEVKDNYDFQNAFGDAYSETATEDGALQELLEDGRTGNWYQIDSLPRHTLLEKGLLLFQNWLMRNV